MSKLTLQKLKTFEKTVDVIKTYILKYWTDILLFPHLLKLNNQEFFNYIQNYKYVADPVGIEFVSRPRILFEVIESKNKFYCDCDDRTVLSGVYFHAKNILNGENNKLKIIVCGQKEAVKEIDSLLFGKIKINYPHHVYLDVNNESFDPTYFENRLGKKLFEEYYRKEYNIY